MDVDIKVVAYSFPAIALVLGFLLLLTGASSNNPDLTRARAKRSQNDG